MASFICDLSCFKKLRQEMYQISYNMYPFTFCFNGTNTFAALYVISNEDRDAHPKLKYVLFHLIFMKQSNLDQTVDCYINSRGFSEYDYLNFRRFFNIKDNPNSSSNFMYGLSEALNNQCPHHAVPISDKHLLQAEHHSLCRKFELDPDHCYPYKIIRLGKDINGNQRYRDPNKYQLALHLMPHATKLYGKTKEITYCFTDDENKAVDESVAIKRFTERELYRQSS